MTELDSGYRALAADEFVDAAVLGNVRIVVDTSAVIRLAAARLDRSFLAEHDACAAHCKFAEVDEMVIGGTAVFGRVLAHRGHDDAIARGHAAELDRRE